MRGSARVWLSAILVVASIALGAFVPPPALASPGGLDSAGCHTCRTNCASYGLATGTYHCHRSTAPPPSGGSSSGGSGSSPPPVPSNPIPAPPPSIPAPAPTFSIALAAALPVARGATVGNTGGTGLAARFDCRAEARSGGPGVAEGATVLVTHTGTGTCAGWSIVTAGATRSWVSDGYLVISSVATSAPATRQTTPTPKVAQPSSATTPTPAAATGSPPASARSQSTPAAAQSAEDANSGGSGGGVFAGGLALAALGGGAYWLGRRRAS